MTTLAVARYRALFGAAFVALGIGIAVSLLMRPEPFNAKILGLFFAVVLALLGGVRIRAYVMMKRDAA